MLGVRGALVVAGPACDIRQAIWPVGSHESSGLLPHPLPWRLCIQGTRERGCVGPILGSALRIVPSQRGGFLYYHTTAGVRHADVFCLPHSSVVLEA